MPVTRVLNVELNVDQLPGPTQEVIDVDTGERLEFWRANSLIFSVSFVDGSGDFDMSGVTKASLEVKSPACQINAPRADFPLMMYQEIEGPFSTGSPVEFDFTADETAIRYGSQWLSVTLYGSAGERMTTVSGLVTVLGNGYGTANVPDVQDLRDQAVQAAIDAALSADHAESEADRAQLIADNLSGLAEALSYRGTWDAAAGAPTGQQRGYFWVISQPGIFGGNTWAAGDAALWNGSAWQKVELDTLVAQLDQQIDSLQQQMPAREQANALVLRGGYAAIPYSPDLMPRTGSMTLEGWAWAPGLPAVQNEGFLTNGRTVSSYPPGVTWAIGATTLQDIRYRELVGGSIDIECVIPVPVQRWYHWAFVRDVANGEVRGYLNGELANTVPVASFADIDNAVGIYIGASTTNTGASVEGPRRWHGNMQRVRMYSYALTDHEIVSASLKKETDRPPAGAFGGQDGVIFDLQPQGIGADRAQWIDSSGNGHHAQMSAAGATSLLEQREFTLSYSDIDLSAPVYLGGARDVLLDGYDCVSVQAVQSAGGTPSPNFSLAYSDGSSSSVFVAGESVDTTGLIITPSRIKPDGRNRLLASDGSNQGSVDLTLKFRKR